jgi:predicted DNA-binding transcriptional regulator YafY
MRADRLVATLLLMQSKGRITAAQLAAELEISVATARRDLEALSTAGVPVFPQPGRNGGWSLVGGARTDLSGLTAGEAQALFLLAGPVAADEPEVRSALRKLVRALPGVFRADAEAAAGAVVVDPARWGQRDEQRPDLVTTLRRLIIQKIKIRMWYGNRAGQQTERLLSPLGLVDKDDIWYLVADTDRGRRTFRVDRILRVEPTAEPADRPDDFDLSTTWQDVVTEVEQHRSSLSATVLIRTDLARILKDHFGRHCTVEELLADGRTRVRVAAQSARSIAEQLAGWGSQVEVLQPPAVRAELARIGGELVRRYADQGPDLQRHPHGTVRPDGEPVRLDRPRVERRVGRVDPPGRGR